MFYQTARPQPRLQALTVERELSFEYDDIGMGESDDELGDDEQPKTTGIKHKIRNKYSIIALSVTLEIQLNLP